MSDMNTDTIYRVAGFFDLEAPPAVTDAEAALEAAIALRATVAAEVAPDLSSVTAKNLAKLHAAAVAWENRDARLRAADAIVKAATDKLENAMFISAQELRQPLADLFNQRAKDFTATLEQMGGNPTLTAGNGEAYARLRATATELGLLRQARDAYSPRGTRAATAHDRFEQMSRVFRIADEHPDALGFHNLSGAEFWAAGIARGHAIAWQDNAEQEQNSRDCVNAKRAALAGR
jgi:hypothetical protein